MTDGYTCPAEGCDYGEEADENKSLAAVRSHINSADDHDWHELKADLYAAAEAEDVPDSYDPEDGDGDAGDDGGEESESGSEDDESTDDNGEMATEEEYQQQHSDGGEDGTEDGASGDQPTPADGDDGGSGFSLPAFSATTWLFIAGLLLAAFLAWRLFGGDAAEDYEPPEESEDDTQATAGMLGEEAVESGTGGVSV
jgi:hypothetical protein